MCCLSVELALCQSGLEFFVGLFVEKLSHAI